jgi:hypothetical protein
MHELMVVFGVSRGTYENAVKIVDKIDSNKHLFNHSGTEALKIMTRS